MSCSCHGDSRRSTTSVKPYDQCLICARKHVVQAWQAWNEFEHELDNRDMCSAELRACASHCKYLERDIAVESRDIAKSIEMFEDDGKIAERIDGLKAKVEEALFRRYPELAERYNKLKEHK